MAPHAAWIRLIFLLFVKKKDLDYWYETSFKKEEKSEVFNRKLKARTSENVQFNQRNKRMPVTDLICKSVFQPRSEAAIKKCNWGPYVDGIMNLEMNTKWACWWHEFTELNLSINLRLDRICLQRKRAGCEIQYKVTSIKINMHKDTYFCI